MDRNFKAVSKDRVVEIDIGSFHESDSDSAQEKGKKSMKRRKTRQDIEKEIKDHQLAKNILRVNNLRHV